MDEPKETTENTTQEEQASGSKTRTPEEEPKLFTQTQLEEAKQLERIKAGREEKTLNARENAANAVLTKAEKLHSDMKADADKRAEQKYRDDLANAGDDPLQRSKVELNRDLRLAREELGDKKTELGKKDERILQLEQTEAVSTKEQNARVIASKYEDDPEAKERLTKSLLLTDGKEESMDALAKTMTGKEAKTLKVDSSKTSGGSGGIPTDMGRFRTWVANLSQSEFEERSADINKMMKENKIK